VGADVRTSILVFAAFGAGQLSIGWCNDWWDAERDAATGRRDKPAATGRIRRSTVGRAAAVAAVLTVPLSLALGWQAGLAHLVAATVLVVLGPDDEPTAAQWLGLALAVVSAAVAAAAGLLVPPRRLLALVATALVAVIDVLLLLGSGTSLR